MYIYIIFTILWGTGLAWLCPPGQSYCYISGGCFDPNTQICCGKMVINKTLGLKCCLRGRSSEPYNPQLKMCCGNELLVRSDLPPDQVCCAGNLRTSSKGICCRDTWNVHTAGKNARCCGNEWFNIATQECCHSAHKFKIHARGNATACCGLKVYNTETQHCDPSGRVLSKFQFECGGQTYNSTEQICCQDHLHNLPSSTHKCCGSRLHDETKETCCRDGQTYKAWPKKDNGECCGTSYIDPVAQQCCDKRVINKAGSDGLLDCCGHQLYNPQTSLCCNHQVFPGADPIRHTCCDGRAVDIEKLQCIDDHVYPLDEKKCKHEESNCVCNGEKIHQNKALCCHAVVTQKGERHHDGCCRSGNMVETYSRSEKDSSPCNTGEYRCNGNKFNPDVYICCNGRTHDKNAFGCCGGHVFFKTSTRKCVDGHLRDVTEIMQCENVCSKKLPKNYKDQAVLMAKVKRIRRKGTPPCIVGMNVMNGGRPNNIQQVRIDLGWRCAQECRLKKGDNFLLMTGSPAKKLRSGRIMYTLDMGDGLFKVTKRTMTKVERHWCRKGCKKQTQRQGRKRACWKKCKKVSL